MFNYIEVILGLSGNNLVLMLFIDIMYKPVAYIVELRLRQDSCSKIEFRQGSCFSSLSTGASTDISVIYK